MEISFRGGHYFITRKSVERVLRKRPDKTRRYAVKVRGRLYPLKQAFAAGVGRPMVRGFNTSHAYGPLNSLGFEIIDLNDCRRKAHR